MGRRYYKVQRDENEMELFRVLEALKLEPLRGQEVDIYCKHMRGHGLMIEVKKNRKSELRPLQKYLQKLFPDRYHVVVTVDDLLEAVSK